MKKRFLSLGLAAVMAMSLTACGGRDHKSSRDYCGRCKSRGKRGSGYRSN